MTEAYTPAPNLEDIDDTAEAGRVRLDRQADAILAEGRSFGPTTSLRQAVRDDAAQARAWAAARAERGRDAIVEEPIRAALYAVGVGVLIGLLLRR